MGVTPNPIIGTHAVETEAQAIPSERDGKLASGAKPHNGPILQIAAPLASLSDQVELFDSTLDPENFSLGPSLTRVMRMSAERMDKVIAEYQPTHIIATVSGGRDSAAEIEFARELGIKIDLILHCRTGTGIPETTKHVIDHYGNLGPNFVMADAGDAYERYVMRKGFFGIGRQAHNFSYRILKADPMRAAISREIRKGKRGVRTLILNGARALESDNRRLNLPETRFDKGNMWVNIIHDWSDGDRDRYLRLRQTSINPVAIQLCRSGECMCGTMQTKQTRGEAAAIYPEWGAWLNDLERRAKAKHGWGWGETMPKPVDPRQIDMFQPMCLGCARDDQRDAQSFQNTRHGQSDTDRFSAPKFTFNHSPEVTDV